MSGRKYSEVELRENVRNAIACKVEAKEACKEAEALLASIKNELEVTPSLKPLFVETEKVLAKIKTQLKEMENTNSEANLLNSSLDNVQRYLRNIENMRAQLREIEIKCREGASASSQRAVLHAIWSFLCQNENELAEWSTRYEAFIQKTQTQLTNIDIEILSTGSISNTEEIIKQRTEFDLLKINILENKKAHAAREYLAHAIQKVCHYMGFEADKLSLSSPLDELKIVVQTFAYGSILFVLPLEGGIRSFSEEIETPSCPLIYPEFEKMMDTLGVRTTFRFDHSDQPVNIKKGERDLPWDDDGFNQQISNK